LNGRTIMTPTGFTFEFGGNGDSFVGLARRMLVG
jgi:hypothetical protein